MKHVDIDALSPSEKRALLARLMRERRAASAASFPLSRQQRALWFMYKMSPEHSALNIGEAVTVRGGLEPNALRRAVARLGERHPALRTLFTETSGEPMQQVHADLVPELAERDATGWDAATLKRAITGHIERPFVLEREVPFRVTLLRRGPEEHVIILSLQHIVGDFWALVILTAELLEFYRAEQAGGAADLAPITATYEDFVRDEAAFLASPEVEAQADYWRTALDGDIPTLALPTDRPRPAVRTNAGRLRTFALDTELSGQIKAFSRAHGVTLYTTLLAGFAIQMMRWSGQGDVVIGSPMTSRNDPRFAGVVGYFMNSLPLRIAAGRDATVADLVRQTRDVALGAFENQAYPMQKIVEDTRPTRGGVLNASPLFDVMFVLRQSPDPRMQRLGAFGMGSRDVSMELTPGLTISPAECEREMSQFDLSLSFVEVDESFHGSWEYSTELFNADTIDRLSGSIGAILKAMIANPDARLDELPLLPEPARRAALLDWNATEAPFPQDALLHELFEDRAAGAPDAVAVIDSDVRLTYRELDRRANVVAHALRASGVAPNQLVAILMDKGWRQVVAAVAVVKAGGAYLPLDAKLPTARLLDLLDQGDVRLALTENRIARAFAWPEAVTPMTVDDAAPGAGCETPPDRVAAADDLAYVIFTSGSTGRPKGVMLNHRGPVNTVLDVNQRLDLTPDDRVLGISSLNFDLSVYDIFGVLAAGAALVLPAVDRLKEPEHWADLVKRERITVWNSVPALLKLLVDHAERDPDSDLSTVRAAMMSGDWIPLDLPDRIRACAPEARVISMGGATEASIWSIWYDIGAVDPTWRSIPYGRPMTNQAFYVLNAALEPCPPGVVGDLYIGGVGVTKGYWRNREKTEAALIPHPELGETLYRTGDLGRYQPDGLIEFLGRSDFQVKLGGFRVEIGEIEAALTAHSAVAECVVLAIGDREKRLCAYFVAKGEVGTRELRAHLAALLPEYMVPAQMVALSAMPLGPNGKIDRKALPEPSAEARDDFVAPSTETERAVAAIWAEVLGLSALGAQDNYFALGGDSVNAIQISGRCRAIGLQIDSRDLFDAQTLAELAALADARGAAQVVAPGRSVPVTAAQATAMAHAPWVCALTSEDMLDAQALGQAVDTVVARHDALRIRRRKTADGWIAETTACIPHGPVEDSDDRAAATQAAANALNPAEGVLLRARTVGRTLVLAADAAAVDAESWPVLLTDLQTAYAAHIRGVDPRYSASSVSFVGWAQAGGAEFVFEPIALPAHGAASSHVAHDLFDEAPRRRRAAPEDLIAAALARVLDRETLVLFTGRGFERGFDGTAAVGAFATERRALVGGDITDSARRLRAAMAGGRPEMMVEVRSGVASDLRTATLSWSFERLDRDESHTAPVAVTVTRRGDDVDIACAANDPSRATEIARGLAAQLEAVTAEVLTTGSAVPHDLSHAGLTDGDLARIEDCHGLTTEVLPLTPMQNTMLLHALLEGDPGLYVEHVVCILRGDVDAAALSRALARVAERHPALHARFVWEDVPRPVQAFVEGFDAEIENLDWRGEPPKDQKAALGDRIAAERAQGFDLRAGQLLRATLIRTEEECAWLVIAHHHLLFDGWSLTLLLQDLVAAYHADLTGGDLSPAGGAPLSDYTDWLARRDPDEERRFWTDTLADFETKTPLAIADRRSHAQGGAFQHGESEASLSAEATAVLRAFCQARKLTMGAVVIGAWALALSRYAHQDRVVIGVTGTGRPEDLSGADQTVGLFINTPPLAVDVADDMATTDWLTDLQARLADVRAHEHVTPAELNRWLGCSDQRPAALFDSIVIVENYPTDTRLTAEGMVVEDVRFTEQTNTPLAIYALPGEELTLRVTFDRRLFDTSTIARVLGHLETTLAAFADKPHARLGDVSILPETETRRLLDLGKGPERPTPEAGLHELLFDQAARTPNAVAIVDQGREVSYAELASRANQFALRLTALGVVPGDNVALLIHRSVDMVAAIYGILATGARYVPIDPSTPEERVAFIVDDCAARLIVTCRDLARCAGPDALVLDDDAIANLDGARLVHETSPSDGAYIIYTSGSTGRPKGVLVPHGAIVNYTEAAAAAYEISPEDRVLQFFSIAFDAANEEIFPTLARGAALVLRPEDALDSMARFLQVLAETAVTHVSLPTPFWHDLVAALKTVGAPPPSLRTMIIGGDRALPARVQTWHDHAPNVRLINTYGPTEATVVATMGDLIDDDAPIGRPVANARCAVMDAKGRLCPAGVPGELWIGGAGVAAGYLNRPELTDACFVNVAPWGAPDRMYLTGDIASWRADGALDFHGRRDDQVKIRGYRVELGEVEAAISQVPGVSATHVATFQDAGRGRAIGAYVVMDRIDGAGLRAHLAARLPHYMVPSAVVLLDALPLNERGKIDRKRLPALASAVAASEGAVPQTQVERALAALWAEVLGVANVGVHDNFFDLGGHSLLAIQLVARMREDVGLEVPMRTFFAAPTVADMAAMAANSERLDLQAEADLALEIVPEGLGGAPGTSPPEDVLLTGATGFLGIFILRELIAASSARIHCIVRAQTEADAMTRIRAALAPVGIADAVIDARIIPVLGDLERPNLGLSEKNFAYLAETVDAIVHNGAKVNFVLPYEMLAPANVSGAREVLRLAATGKIAAVHFISSLAIFPDGHDGPEDDVNFAPDMLSSGYAQSKWVTERMMTTARERGLPVSIYRPGRITGHARTGEWSTNDLLYRMLRGSLDLGAVPDIDIAVDMTPVDFVARTVVCGVNGEATPPIAHLVNPAPTTLAEIVKVLRARGYSVDAVPMPVWLARAAAAVGEDEAHPLYPLLTLLPLWADSLKPQPDRAAKFGWRNTARALEALGMRCPAADARLINVYLDWFASEGALAAPEIVP